MTASIGRSEQRRRLWSVIVPLLLLAGACASSDLPVAEGPGTTGASLDVSAVEPDPTDPGGDAGEGQTTARSGFDIVLQDGTWWEYGFSRSEQSFAQRSGAHRSDSSGRFLVSLGASRVIDGVSVHTVQVVPTTGDVPDFEVTRWRFMGVDDGDLVGSTDGSHLDTIFGATAEFQAGGGFFAEFGPDELLTAAAGRLVNEFVEAEAVVLGASSEEGRCEYFASVGNICTGERDSSLAVLDYFETGIGPLGHSYSFAFEDCGGGFCSGSSEQISIGLVDHSLVGDRPPAVDPPAAPATATGFVALADDTTTITVDVPAGWIDATTRPVFDGETGAELPTIAAAPSLDGFLGSYAGSGVLFQAIPTPAPDDLIAALDTVTAADATACTTGATEQFSGPDHRLARRVLLDCDGADADLVWIVGELDSSDWTVIVVIQLASEADQAYLEPIITSLRLTA